MNLFKKFKQIFIAGGPMVTMDGYRYLPSIDIRHLSIFATYGGGGPWW